MQEVIDDLSKIEAVYKIFSENQVFEGSLNLDKSPKIGMIKCGFLAYSMYINRFGYCSTSVNLLLKNDKHIDNQRVTEFSSVILLRTCLLDCIQILAWLNDPDLICALVTESYTRIKQHHVEPQAKFDNLQMVKDHLNYMNWTNAEILKKVSLNNLIKTISDEVLSSNVEKLYSWYSKFDHFTLLPILHSNSEEEMVANFKVCTSYIKVCMFELFKIFEMDSFLLRNYWEFLRLK